ncbi:MAG: PAS domain S-box protein [Candidatus Aminicenantes bacterium]|nr:PAS domain S-box protein [Candidatus Aminicenantes bacterium]
MASVQKPAAEKKILEGLEKSLRLRFELEKEVGDICREFITQLEFDKAVGFSLERFGRLFEADRAAFIQWNNAGVTGEKVRQWVREESLAGAAFPVGLNINDFPWWRHRLRAGEIFEVTDLESLPQEAEAEKNMMRKLGFSRLIIFPVFHDNRPTGFFGIINFRRRSLMEESTRRLLSIASQVMSASLGRQRADEDLREISRRYDALFNRSNDAVFIMDLRGIILTVNDRAVRMMGGSREEVIGREYFSFVSPKEQENARNQFRLSITGVVLPHFARTYQRSDGTPVFTEVNLALVRDEKGRPWRIQSIARDIGEWKRSTERMIQAMKGSIAAMAAAMEKRDPYTSGHQIRVTRLALAIAREMRLDPTRSEGLQFAGSIHDIGKLMIPSEILSKPGRLSELESDLIKKHPETGNEILKNIEFPWPVGDIVSQHHEKIDGSGYPRGLRGDEILLESRILCVADVVEAMSSHRPYRPALGLAAAVGEITNGRGTLFDPSVVDACVGLLRRENYSEIVGN